MPPHVLVIDDSLDIHRLLAVRLRNEGLDLRHAYTGAEGLSAALLEPPDLVLLDVDLPDSSGFDICRALKEDDRTRAVPVMFLTGSGDVDTKVRGFDLGAIDYVTKPFEPAELRARVRSALRTKQYQDLLATRAQVDALTGLWNRSHLSRRLEEEVGAAQRHGRIVSLVMVDIDHFKGFNDRFGHPFGDRALIAVAQALADGLRASDVACRYGGEEFALILPDVDGDGAEIAARRLMDDIRRIELAFGSEHPRVTASFGVACTNELAPHDLTPQGLLSAGDRALYAAKAGGRNRIARHEAAA